MHFVFFFYFNLNYCPQRKFSIYDSNEQLRKWDDAKFDVHVLNSYTVYTTR